MVRLLRCCLVVGLAVLAALPAQAAFDRFEAAVGMDDDAIIGPASSNFQVFLDGQMVYDSGVMRPLVEPKRISVPLGDAKELRLVVTEGGDTIRNDRADWADARLVDSATGGVAFLSDLPYVARREWIRTVRDRTITSGPIVLKGTVYPKGLGTFALLDMVLTDWNRVVEERKQRAEAEEAAARKELGDDLRLRFPAGAVRAVYRDGKLVYDGAAEGRGTIVLSLRTVHDLAIEVLAPRGTPLLGPAVLGTVEVASRHSKAVIPLCSFAPSRVEHLGQGALTASDAAKPMVLAGAPYAGMVSAGVPARLHFQHLASAFTEALKEDTYQHEAKANLFLEATVGVDNSTTDTGGSVVFRVVEDERSLYTSPVLTASDLPLHIRVPISGKGLLRLVAEDAGDGGYLDIANWANARIVDGEGRLLTYLGDAESWIKRQNYGTPADNRSMLGGAIVVGGEACAHGLGMASPAEVSYRGVGAYVAALAQSKAEAQKGERLFKEGDLVAAEKAFQKALELDEANATARTYLALIAEEGNSPWAALRAWLRVLDHAVTTLADRDQATRHLDALYNLLYPVKVVKQGGTEPKLLERAGSLADLAAAPFAVQVGKGYARTDEAVLRPGLLPLTVTAQEAGKHLRLIVNSRGLAVRLQLRAGHIRPGDPRWKEHTLVADSPASSSPLLAWQTTPGLYTLVILHDPKSDGYEQDFLVYCAGQVGQEPPKTPEESWEYGAQGDGGLRSRVTVTGPSLILVPLTAVDLKVESGQLFYCLAAYNYGSSLGGWFSRCFVGLLIPQGKEAATVSFLWQDGACNVPDSHWNGEARTTYYIGCLISINPGVESFTVRLRPTPGSGTVRRTFPENFTKEGDLYVWRVRPEQSVAFAAEDASVKTSYLTRTHRNMVVLAPKTDYYGLFIDEFVDNLKPLYDRLLQEMGGYQAEKELFFALPNPAQLPGYGGATWGDPKVSESWIGVAGHMGHYPQRYAQGAFGVDSHESHWMFGGGTIPDMPWWFGNGWSAFLEIQGDVGCAHLGYDLWPRNARMKTRAQAYLSDPQAVKSGHAWTDEETYRTLDPQEQENVLAMQIYAMEYFQNKYGPDFWGKFWQYERQNRTAFSDLPSYRTKTIKVVEDIAQVAGDASVRQVFKDWGMDLAPDAAYNETNYLALPHIWRFRAGDDVTWANADVDDAAWEQVEILRAWEEYPGHENLDGYGWFRLRFVWPKSLSTEQASLWLGKVDDADETFFNGQKIGASGEMVAGGKSAYDQKREYAIPESLIKPGETNVIAVRVFDYGDSGGITSGPVAVRSASPGK